MRGLGRNLQPIHLVLIGIMIVLLLTGGSSILFSSLGYVSGYQGVRPSFAGVKYEGEMSQLFGSSLNFEPDAPDRYKPNIVGEMSGAFVPRESLGASWVPPDWIRQAFEYIHNPIASYEWKLTDSVTNTTSNYRMEEWLLKWYVSIGAVYDDVVGLEWLGNQECSQRYTNTEIWFELDLTPIWYFEGQTTAYFAIAKVTVGEIAFGGSLNKAGTEYSETARQRIKVTPESEGHYLTMYYALGGTTAPEITAQTYQGRKLNPTLFRDKVYTMIRLDNFGCDSWYELLTLYKRGDVVTFGFNVHVYVVGQWDVKDIESQKKYEDYGKEAQYGVFGIDWHKPLTWGLMGLLGILIIIALIIIFAPWLFAVLGLGLIRRRKR